MNNDLLQRIYDATNNGLDIILWYYPQAQGCDRRGKYFKIRGDERTASACMKEIKGVWRVTDFGAGGTRPVAAAAHTGEHSVLTPIEKLRDALLTLTLSVMENRSADIVAFAAGNRLQDIDNLLGGAHRVFFRGGGLTPGTFAPSAPVLRLLDLIFVHTIHNFGIFAARKPKEEKGGGLIPLFGQKIPISKRILIFQILNEIVTFIFLWVFVFPTLYRFRIPVSFIPERHGKDTKYFDIVHIFSK